VRSPDRNARRGVQRKMNSRKNAKPAKEELFIFSGRGLGTTDHGLSSLPRRV
jgi:hypothetical protein